MRQVALIVILAQAGFFVPADSADLCITDRVFTRVGASDDLHTGRSTFMVEMSEVSYILNNATDRSLILLDEMFSSTSSFEGTVIAARVLKYFAQVGCKCIYTTHMHDLIPEIEAINAEPNIKSRVDGLSAELINRTATYRIKRCRESYHGYAEEICKKYGFDF